jgi:4-diphosphocytidyl-2-C-methyl-D-erythritol kinase
MSRVVRLTCGAKLNLFLKVTGRRPDGFHELESVFHAIDLVDELHVESDEDGHVETTMTWAPEAAGPPIEPRDNIVQRTALALRERSGVRAGARITLVKRIPVGGGLGGGSSDAAGALAGLGRLWSVPEGMLEDLAPELGSDVPFCLRGGSTALVTGRGEHVERRPGPPEPLWFVLGLSDRPLLTEQVYTGLGARTESGPPEGGLVGEGESVAVLMSGAIGAGEASEVAALLRNDLRAPAVALRPEIELGRTSLLEAGALGAEVSGSGPTVFGVARDESHARALAADIGDSFDRVAVARSAPACVAFV